MNKKPFYTSKTIWFNIALALFSVISENTVLLREYMSSGGYLVVLMLVSAGNAFLRTVTTQPIAFTRGSND